MSIHSSSLATLSESGSRWILNQHESEIHHGMCTHIHMVTHTKEAVLSTALFWSHDETREHGENTLTHKDSMQNTT